MPILDKLSWVRRGERAGTASADRIELWALTDVLTDCYVAFSWASSRVGWGDGAHRIACGRLQIYASQTQEHIGIRWTVPRGRTVEFRWMRDTELQDRDPRILVTRTNVIRWEPPPERKRGEIPPAVAVPHWPTLLSWLPTDPSELKRVVAFERNSGLVEIAPPPGNEVPPRDPLAHDGFYRDPAVRAWALRRADGRCEACGVRAPFELADGTPYLEVHHLRRLADGGPDTLENTAALCPNCHREVHLGRRGAEVTSRLVHARSSR